MNALFLRILNLAINASWLIIAVIAARIFLNKSPKWISCLLWGLVAVRLLCPVSLESALSLLPSGKVIPENIEMVKDPHIESGVRIIDNTVNPVLSNSFSPDVASSVNPMQVAVSLGGVIWLIGMAAKDPNFEKLEIALAMEEPDDAFEAAHALKGVLGNLALTPLFEPANEMCELLHGRTEMDYDPLLEQLMQAKAQLDALLAE